MSEDSMWDNASLVHVHLRVWHPTESPDAITALVELAPDLVSARNEVRKRPSGRPYPPARENHWSYEEKGEDGAEERIARIAEHLAGREARVRGLVETGGRAEVWVFLGIDGPHVLSA